MCPFVSVIIVTYNASEFVTNCLRSVKHASDWLCKNAYAGEQGSKGAGEILPPCSPTHLLPCTEVIVIDNASQDDTVSIIRQFDWVRLIVNEENLGFAAGINLGAKVANGEWLLVLNPDCVLDENALVSFNKFVTRNSSLITSVGIIGFQLLHPDGRLQPSGRRFPKAWEFALSVLWFQRWMEACWFEGRNFKQVQEVDEVSGAAFAIRRDVFEQISGMDDGFFLFFEELDLCRRVKQAGFRIVYFPEAKAIHSWGASIKQVPMLARLAQQQSAIRYFRKHHGCAVMLIRIALLLQQFGRFFLHPEHWHFHRISFTLLLSPEKPFHLWRTLMQSHNFNDDGTCDGGYMKAEGM